MPKASLCETYYLKTKHEDPCQQLFSLSKRCWQLHFFLLFHFHFDKSSVGEFPKYLNCSRQGRMGVLELELEQSKISGKHSSRDAVETVQGGVPPYGVKETLVVNGGKLLCRAMKIRLQKKTRTKCGWNNWRKMSGGVHHKDNAGD